MLDTTEDFARQLHEKRKAFRANIERTATSLVQQQQVAKVAHEPPPIKTADVEKPAGKRWKVAEARLRKAEADIDAKIAASPQRAETIASIADSLQKWPTCYIIQHIVAYHYNITRRYLLSRDRTIDVVLPRHIAMYLSKALTLRSLPEIGLQFGGVDHTTVLHAVRKIEAMMHGGSSPRFSRGHYTSGRVKSYEPDDAFTARVEFIAADIVERMLAKEQSELISRASLASHQACLDTIEMVLSKIVPKHVGLTNDHGREIVLAQIKRLRADLEKCAAHQDAVEYGKEVLR